MELRVQEYIEGVLSREILTSDLTRLAVQRHVDNLERQEQNDFPYRFDEQEAERTIKMFAYLNFYKGEKAGESMLLEPWQQYYTADVFGWMAAYGRCENCGTLNRVQELEGNWIKQCQKCREKEIPGTDREWYRKYTTTELWIARKNGKTTISAGYGHKGLTKDGENAPQVYSIATKAEQAEICWRDAKLIGESSPALKDRLDFYTYSIVNPSNNGFFKYLASDSKSMDGLDPYYVIADELHAHKDSKVIDVMKSGMGARKQPLFIGISTSGFLLNGTGKEHYDYCEKILRGVVQNESWHTLIYTLDKDDDWKDPEMWFKANPNMGVSTSFKSIMDEFKEARGIPSKEVDFKTKRLNLWVSSKTGYISHENWDKCNKGEVTLDDFKGREVKMALDLGEVSDFTAFGILGLPKFNGDDYIVKMWYWIPELTLEDRKNSELIEPWCGKWITTTEGNATDFDHVEDDIREVIEQGLTTSELHFDPNKGQQIPQHLAELEIEPITIPQSYKNLNPGVDEMERLVLDERVNFGNDPVLAWMNSNVVVIKNRDGYRKFDKGQSQDKIDGMVVLEMLFAQVATLQEEEDELLEDPVH